MPTAAEQWFEWAAPVHRAHGATLLVSRNGSTTTSTANEYDIALVTTDLTATAEEIIARYAARRSLDVTFFNVTNILGVGNARNRVPKAVQRTVPFGLPRHSILIVWYALHGHDQDGTAQRRRSAPWYKIMTEPSTLDMLINLRRQIIATRFLPTTPRPATIQEIIEVQQAWTQAAA